MVPISLHLYYRNGSSSTGDAMASIMGVVNLTLPDDVLKGRQITEEELRFNLALGLFINDKATLGQAARLAGMSTPAFLDELGKRRIPVHYGLEDLAADEATLRAIAGDKRD